MNFKSFDSLIEDKYFDSDKIDCAKKLKGFHARNLHVVTTVKSHVKCYCLSDIHADSVRGLDWIQQNCTRKSEDEHTFTVFIVPGDVGTLISKVKPVLEHLVQNFDLVSYVPGNHEAWVCNEEDGLCPSDSIHKLQLLDKIVRKLGVFTTPVLVLYEKAAEFRPVISVFDSREGSYSGNNQRGLYVFPLHSWYHSSWDKEGDIVHPLQMAMEEAIPFDKRWSDFRSCKWPKDLLYDPDQWTSVNKDCLALAEAFASVNEIFLHPPPSKSTQRLERDEILPLLGSPWFDEKLVASCDATVLSFSHFVPRNELSPEKRYLISPLLSKVIGSDLLESQIRRLQSDIHLFGHTHCPIDLTLGGIRYIQWPLGYAREADKQCHHVFTNGPLLFFDSALGNGQSGVPRDALSQEAYWTKHYQANQREPDRVNELAPWVVKLFEQNYLVRQKMTSPEAQSTTKDP